MKLILLVIFVLIVLISLKIITDTRRNYYKNKISKINREINSNNGIISFPKYYINLDRSIKRNDGIIKHFKKYKLKNYQKFKGIDGSNLINLKKGIVDNYNYINNSKEGNIKELAITMSHLLAMNKAKKDGHDFAIIMEDDCRFNLVPYWKKDIITIISEIPSDCEIFLLANRKEKKGNWEIVEITEHYTGVCYIITKKGMNKLEKFINGNNIIFNIDNIIFDQGFLKQFKVYSYDNPLILLDNFEFFSTHSVKYLDINSSTKNVLDNFENIFIH